MSKIKRKKKLTAKQKNKIKFDKMVAKQVAIKMAECDEKYAAMIKGLTQRVKNFMEPVNRLIECMNDGMGFVLYKEGKNFVGYVGKAATTKLSARRNRNLEYIVSSENLSEIFRRAKIKEEDIAAFRHSNVGGIDVEISKDVPPDVAFSFLEGLSLASKM